MQNTLLLLPMTQNMSEKEQNILPVKKVPVLFATTDRKKLFREKTKAKIRDAIGLSNRDQEDKEALLVEICSRITSVCVKTLE